MTIISLDFSVLFPGVCVCKDFKEFKWLAIVNSKLTKKKAKHLDDLCLKYPNISFSYTLSERKKDPKYHLTERNKLINYEESTDLLIDLIKSSVDLEDDLIVVIEGISFGSKGNALVDISQSTGIIRSKLVNQILKGDFDRFFVFSPGELKNAIGCKGNAGKGEIFDKFIDDPIIEAVKGSDLYEACITEEWIKDSKGNIESPIMDMVDSYLGAVKIYETLKITNNNGKEKEERG